MIIMDVQMPLLDGIATTRHLRQQGLTIPIVALTANATEADKNNCIAAGMNEFISKPFKPENSEYVLKDTFLKSYL